MTQSICIIFTVTKIFHNEKSIWSNKISLCRYKKTCLTRRMIVVTENFSAEESVCRNRKLFWQDESLYISYVFLRGRAELVMSSHCMELP